MAFFLPLFGLIALIIKLSDGGSIFYRYWRIGHARQSFECLKFRTMVMDGDEVLRRHLVESYVASREWHERRKLKRDPRVTAFGAILRKLSLDELPQLVNVLRGHMSLVGPRPLPVRDVLRFDAAWLMRRFSVKPGLTCLWQVNGRSDTDFERWVRLDLQYIDNWSLSLDMEILIKTVPAVFSGTGAM